MTDAQIAATAPAGNARRAQDGPQPALRQRRRRQRQRRRGRAGRSGADRINSTRRGASTAAHRSRPRADVDGDGTAGTPNDQLLARQLYARHLYVQMLAADELPRQSGQLPPTRRSDDARRVAQWAVNIVDFRDRDAIMTPFEYDIEPFDATAGAWTASSAHRDGRHRDVRTSFGAASGRSCSSPRRWRSTIGGRKTWTSTAARSPTGDTQGFRPADEAARVAVRRTLLPWTIREAAPGEFYIDRAEPPDRRPRASSCSRSRRRRTSIPSGGWRFSRRGRRGQDSRRSGPANGRPSNVASTSATLRRRRDSRPR